MDLETQLRDFTTRDWQDVDDGGPIRFAMIGIGWWVREFAIPAVRDSQLCETTVAISSSREKAQSVVEENETVEHGITYEEFHDGTAADAYDAIYICTPNAFHLEHVETAAELDKAVLCEKPMEVSVERSERMVDAAESAGIPLRVAYRMHLEPAVRQARELVREGFIGEPLHAHGNMSQMLLRMFDDPDHWRLKEDLSGGASVMDLGIYPLNTTRFITDADPVAVQGMMRAEREAFDDVPDEHAAFQVEYDDGLLGAFTASQNSYNTGHLRIAGSEGELVLDQAFFANDRGLRLSVRGTSVDYEFRGVDQMTEEFDHFANGLLTDAEFHADGRHGLTDMRALRAVYESAESGSIVRL